MSPYSARGNRPGFGFVAIFPGTPSSRAGQTIYDGMTLPLAARTMTHSSLFEDRVDLLGALLRGLVAEAADVHGLADYVAFHRL